MPVRKCRIDFGVDIRIDTEPPARLDPHRPAAALAAPSAPSNTPSVPNGEPRFQGQLIYIKPSLPRVVAWPPSTGDAARPSNAASRPTSLPIDAGNPRVSASAHLQSMVHRVAVRELPAARLPPRHACPEGRTALLLLHRLATAISSTRSAETSRAARARSPRTARGPALGRRPGPGGDRSHRRRHRRAVRSRALLADASARWRRRPTPVETTLYYGATGVVWALGYLHAVGAISGATGRADRLRPPARARPRLAPRHRRSRACVLPDGRDADPDDGVRPVRRRSRRSPRSRR